MGGGATQRSWLCFIILAWARAEKHTMIAGGGFQSVGGIPGTTGIVRMEVDDSGHVDWASVGAGVYSPGRESTVNAVVMLDAPGALLAGGDFVMAGKPVGANVDNQTAAWGFAHFDGSRWEPGYRGLRMVATSQNEVHVLLHTHVYKDFKWEEHVLLGGKFYAQIDGGKTFFSNFVHHDGKKWTGLTGPDAPESHEVIRVLQKYSSDDNKDGPQDKIMIGGSNYFRFYDAKGSKLEGTCRSDVHKITALTTVCNGWVYAAVDGPLGTKRFKYGQCGDEKTEWANVPEETTGCPLTQVRDMLCVDSTKVVAVGEFKMPRYRAAFYDTTKWALSDSSSSIPARFVHANDTEWQGEAGCCKKQTFCATSCEHECEAKDRPFSRLATVAQNPGERGHIWVAGKPDAAHGGSAMARIRIPGTESTSDSGAVARFIETGSGTDTVALSGGTVSTLQAVNSSSTPQPALWLVMLVCLMSLLSSVV